MLTNTSDLKALLQCYIDLLPQSQDSRRDLLLHRMVVDRMAFLLNQHQKELKPIYADRLKLLPGEKSQDAKDDKKFVSEYVENNLPFHERLS